MANSRLQFNYLFSASCTLRTKRNSIIGFTLIEVVFALVVLGGSLVVLLGLQSSLITRSLRDESQERAILMTRELLAPLEAGISSADDVEVSGTFKEVYSKVVKDAPSLPELSEQDAAMTFTYSIAPWKIEGIDGDVMKKVTVVARWGQSSADQTTTNYFVPVT